MNAKKLLLKSAALLTLLMVPATFIEAHTDKRKSRARTSFQTPILKNIDRVELMSIESRMGGIEKVDATMSVEGRGVQHILSVWRKQKFTGYSAAACHQPPYALKFYSKGKLVLFATVCWACNNVTFIVPDIKGWVAFRSESRAAMLLREVFQKAFPSDRKFG